ncbi:TPA: hypothetical protein ACPJP6_001362 [Haemophilus influenzae]|nr:hypothetical protein [Haemophilus influenzae]AVJ00174.1 hypothetical protein BV121_1586 [Haemophilus influenzae]AVJ02110.1 hypothetical protein BV122_1678 [Haemophilus influenzae]
MKEYFASGVVVLVFCKDKHKIRTTFVGCVNNIHAFKERSNFD